MKLDFRIPGHYTLVCPLNRSMERLHADADVRQFFCFSSCFNYPNEHGERQLSE